MSSLDGGEVKEKYVSSQRAEHYKAFEQLLEHHGASGAFAVSGAKLSFADALLFSQVSSCDASHVAANATATAPSKWRSRLR